MPRTPFSSPAAISSPMLMFLLALVLVLGPYTPQAESGSDTPTLPKEPTEVPSDSKPPGVGSPSSPTEQPTQPPSPAPPEDEEIPLLSLPDPPTDEALSRLPLAARPYSIYVGSVRELPEGEATLREFRSHGLPAYLSPVDVRGPVAQSLYGVSQDGLWYRILVGNYTSPQSARKTLKFIMEKLSTYQPEILKFPYALECARVLDPSEADKMTSTLAARGLFPYMEIWRADQERTLYRILLGCYFSRTAATSFQRELEAKGVSCKPVER